MVSKRQLASKNLDLQKSKLKAYVFWPKTGVLIAVRSNFTVLDSFRVGHSAQVGVQCWV